MKCKLRLKLSMLCKVALEKLEMLSWKIGNAILKNWKFDPHRTLENKASLNPEARRDYQAFRNQVRFQNGTWMIDILTQVIPTDCINITSNIEPIALTNVFMGPLTGPWAKIMLAELVFVFVLEVQLVTLNKLEISLSWSWCGCCLAIGCHFVAICYWKSTNF